MSELHDTSSERDACFRSLPSFNYNKPRDELFRFGKDRSLVRIRIPKFAKIFGDGAR